MSVLHVENLRKVYEQGGAQLEVLQDISFAINAGEVVALTGASGSGKSTLLQVAGLLDLPSSGSIIITGEEVRVRDEAQRTRLRRGTVGFVYQFHHLLHDFTALENVMLARRIMGDSNHAAIGPATDLLERMGLSHRLHHRPGELSGGEQQRVAIARAIVAGAKLLLADEPTGNLDDDNTAAVFDILRDIAHERQIGALIATHDRSLAKRMDRQLVIKQGVLADF